MFDPVDPKQAFPELERGILKYWQEEDTFKRSIRARSLPRGDMLDGPAGTGEQRFSFYDGPPFATGVPHYGHLLAGTIKDVIPRYQTMRGMRVERRFGWDCHGLPIENLIEKEHNLGSKKDIEAMGVKAFNDLCRGAVQRYTKEWRTVVDRVGRWVDMDWDYRTMDPDYMESIWWVFQSLHEKGLIYEGHKPMHICPRCQTPLSNFEVTQGYKDITDQSATVMFELEDGVGSTVSGAGRTYVLAWTTTPWTLPGNLFLAVNPGEKYAMVKCDGNRYIVAAKRLETVFKGREYEQEGKEFAGKSLVGRRFRPLFPYFAERYGETAFRVVAGDFVTMEDGTGVVHIAPGFGEDDFRVGQQEKVPLLQHIGMDGRFTPEVTDFAGAEAKPKDDHTKGDKAIAAWLKAEGKLFSSESYTHSYPHCWRCDSPLLNYATSSWFVAVEKIKEDMLASNSETCWIPGHLRDGRFGRWLEGARDWAISRSRYWGTPLPIWRNAATKEVHVIGGREELMKRKPARFTKVTVVRHGESDGNLIPKYQGVVPGTDLTKRGRDQAAATGDALAAEDVTQVYFSPLARTVQTAAIIAKKTGAPAQEDERLREVAFGEYENKTVDFSDLTFVKARRAHKLETKQVESIYHFPGMETWSQVQGRIRAFLAETLPRHRGEHIVLVTHADPLLSVKHFFNGQEPAKLCQQPYPSFAEPFTFYWDHDTQAELDLHKESVDEIAWPGSPADATVHMTLVRHGETEWNKLGKVQGDGADIPLNDDGREQARTLAKKLRGKDFDCIVCSDLSRARETAAILGEELNLPITGETSLLRERNLGDWNGRTITELLKEHPYPFPDAVTLSLHYATPASGESLSAFFRRLEHAHDWLLTSFPGKKVLVVAHTGVLRGLKVLTGEATYREAVKEKVANAAAVEIPLHPLLKRIPEVLDCWFESGSMPYAQSHFPFERRPGVKKKTKAPVLPPGFPADFIAEGIDQTRGWFYTLTVLSAALFKKPAFLNCVVNGTVLAEDGKKMSKRLKNYPEPLEIVEKYGADAVRFALMSSPAVRGEDLRFSARLVEETLRGVLLPLWNTYAFFVTYANAAKWEPTETRRTSNHPLDRWIRAEVQDLVNRMTEQLERYDLSATCAELQDTVDALTNWYVRLSRRRFAGKPGLHASAEALEEMHEQDRLDALITLYDVLLTLGQVLAPFCPFLTEAMYLNLVPQDHGSIHLTDWPLPRTLTPAERSLLTRTRLLRTVVSLGLKVRADKKIKTRQPLARATVAVPASLLDGDLSSEELSLLQEELNVKAVEVVDDPGSLAQAVAMVDARKVGPRLGSRVQEIIKAGKQGDFQVQDDGMILILDERLSPDEATIVYRGKEGEDVCADRGVVVSLDTRVSPELKLEGRTRDLIRAIQQMRKEAGLSPQDRITLTLTGADDILAGHQDTLLQATGATLGKAKGEDKTIDLDGGPVTVRFTKV